MLWKHIPKIWNTRAYILGGGPSLLKIDLERLRHSNVIAVNNAYEEAPWAPFLYAQDCHWFRDNAEVLEAYTGEIVTSCNHFKNSKRVKWLQRGIRNQYDDRPGFISRGSNSGHGALCLAVMLGATEPILLGFDMHSKNGHNYHTKHTRVVPDTIYETNFFVSFEMLKPDLDRMGVKVLNATPGSALPTFPIVDPEEVLP